MRRAVTVVFESHLPAETWRAMVDEIVETVEQIACDYAASCDNDEYEVDVYAYEVDVYAALAYHHEEGPS